MPLGLIFHCQVAILNLANEFSQATPTFALDWQCLPFDVQISAFPSTGCHPTVLAEDCAQPLDFGLSWLPLHRG